MSKDHSEPAFPSMSHEYGPVLGLSIRDYFAANAPDVPADYDWAPNETDWVQKMIRWRYEYADLMLEERAK